MDDEWLTTSDIALRLKVDRHSVVRWIRDGKLRAVRIQVGQRGIYRIRAADYRVFLRRYVRDE